MESLTPGQHSAGSPEITSVEPALQATDGKKKLSDNKFLQQIQETHQLNSGNQPNNEKPNPHTTQPFGLTDNGWG